VSADRVRVVHSARLGALTDIEQQIAAQPGVELVSAALDTTERIHAHAAGAAIVMAGAVEPLDDAAFAPLTDLVAVVRRGVGVDNVDLAAATRRGIVVAHVPDASVEEVSDHALALLLAGARRLKPLDTAIANDVWGDDPGTFAAVRQPMPRLGQTTLGIVGFGRIGRALARKARGVVGRILVHDPYAPATADGVEIVDLDTLLAGSDLISLHTPATPETEHLIDERSLALLRDHAVLVNTSRGALIDEDALVAALTTGRLGGVGLDVTEHEPIGPEHPLARFPNVTLTGHSAASSTVASTELRRRATDAALAVLQGRRPDAIANPEVLDHPSLRLALIPTTPTTPTNPTTPTTLEDV
jgi:D-3-phosphoglycerate dehydrogenase